MNTMFECLYVFCLRKGLSIKLACNCWGDGGSSKKPSSAHRGRGSHALCVPTHLHYHFLCFYQHFVLFYLQKFNVTLIEKRCVCHEWLFCSNEINFFCHEIRFSHLKLFLVSWLAKTLLILIKQNIRYTLYFSMAPYLKKPCAAQPMK